MSTSSEYLLPADASDSERLNAQHKVITRTMNNRLWSGPLEIKDLEGANVLDSGTGTGIWLEDLQTRMQSAGIQPAGLYGIDVSEKQWSIDPDNPINFEKMSVTKLPEKWSNTFKFIHQRLLLVALKKEEWLECVAQFYRVLQSDGYVSFCEADFQNQYIGQDAPAGKLAQIGTDVFKSRNMVPEIGHILPEMLKNAGFVDIEIEDVRVDVCRSNGKEAALAADVFKDVFVKLGLAISAMGNRIISKGDYDALVDGLQDQWDRQNSFFPFKCISARKP